MKDGVAILTLLLAGRSIKHETRPSGICRHEKINIKLPTQFLETTMRSEEMVKIRHEFREKFEKNMIWCMQLEMNQLK